MRITTENYLDVVKDLDWSELPPILQKTHNSLALAAAEDDWVEYHNDEDIRRVLDSYFQMLAEEILKHGEVRPSKATRAKKAATGEQQTKKKAAAPAKKAAATPGQKQAKRKAPAKKKKEKPQSNAKVVEHIESDVRFVQRYVSMNGKEKSRQQILSLFQGLQKAIIERRITKQSKFAIEIDVMERSLKNCLDKMGETVTVEIDPQKLETYKAIADSERVAGSVNLLKAYISLKGKKGMQERAAKLHTRIKLALDKKLIPAADRYIEQVRAALKNLGEYLKKKQGMLNIDNYELNGLAGIGSTTRKKAAAKKKAPAKKVNIDHYDVLQAKAAAGNKTRYSDGFSGLGSTEDTLGRQLPGIPLDQNAQVYSGAQIINMRFDSIGLKGRLLELIGDPSPGFTAMIYGKPKQGKSTFAILMGKELAAFGKVLYCALEESIQATLQKKIVMMKAYGVHYSGGIPANIGDYKFVFLDSVSDAKLNTEQLKALKKQFPHICFIHVFHATKAGNFKGSQQYAHDVDILIEVKDGMAYATGRYAPPGQMKIDELQAGDNYKIAA